MRKQKSNKRRNYLLLGMAAVILLLIIARQVGWIGGKTLPLAETTVVTRKTVIEEVIANGKIQPTIEVAISADISGEIIELPFKEGDKVKKGQIVCRIRPDQYQRGVERAEANVNAARSQMSGAKASYAQIKAQLERATLLYNRQKKLYAEHAISLADFETSEAEYKALTAQAEGAKDAVESALYNLNSVEASRREARDQLTKTTLYAPMDGYISRLNKQVGERVVGTMQMEGSEILRIAKLDAMEVQVEINEMDIVKIHHGDSAKIEVDAMPGQIFSGYITEIASSSAGGSGAGILNTDKVTNFVIKVRISPQSYSQFTDSTRKSPTPFRPGMSATVAIQSKKVNNALVVPITAVTVRNSEGKRDTAKSASIGFSDDEVVFILKNDSAKMQQVKTGIQDDKNIVILSGLSENQVIISGPFSLVSQKLKDGDKVSVKSALKQSGRNAKKN